MAKLRMLAFIAALLMSTCGKDNIQVKDEQVYKIKNGEFVNYDGEDLDITGIYDAKNTPAGPVGSISSGKLALNLASKTPKDEDLKTAGEEYPDIKTTGIELTAEDDTHASVPLILIQNITGTKKCELVYYSAGKTITLSNNKTIDAKKGWNYYDSDGLVGSPADLGYKWVLKP